MKKNMQSVVSQLAPIAQNMPSQQTHKSSQSKAPIQAEKELLVQFSFSLRKSLRRDLKRLADDSEMTTRAFILNALKEKGLNVLDDDMSDQRKGRRV